MKKFIIILMLMLAIGISISNIAYGYNPITTINNEGLLKINRDKPISTGPVRVVGRELQVDFDNNGEYETYQIKGVGYQPTPIGQSPDWGYNFFADTQLNNYTNRDFPWLRDMYVNTIRTWAKADNLNFLNNAYNDNQRPIRVVMGYWIDPQTNYSDPVTRQNLIDDFRNYVATYKNNPAVLIWALGNENNLAFPPNIGDFYSLCNEMALAAYQEEGSDYHPVAIINGGILNIGNSTVNADDTSLEYVDIWGTNVYPGYSFLDQNYFTDYAFLSQKPLYISEFGIDAWYSIDPLVPGIGYEIQDVQADWDVNQWDEVNACDVCVGGTFMEYSDEWWKGGYPLSHDYNGYSTVSWDPLAQPDSFSNEEWWGIMWVEDNPSGIDIMHPRLVYFALQERFYYNNPPELDPIGNKNGLEGHLLQFEITATDADNDQLEFTVANLPLGAELIDNNDNTATFIWTPAWNQAGIYNNIYIEVDDGHGGSDYEEILITIDNWQLAPIPVTK